MVIEGNDMERHPVEAGLTCVTDPLCNLHLRTDPMGRRVCVSLRIVFCRRSRLGGDWKRCQPGRHDTSEMRTQEHRVGKQTRATVRHCKNGGSTIHTQTRPQETPPAKTDSKDKGRRRFHTIQQPGDMLARCLDGHAPDAQGAP